MATLLLQIVATVAVLVNSVVAIVFMFDTNDAPRWPAVLLGVCDVVVLFAIWRTW